MNILLANDDGIDSPGIKILEEKLSKNHNVYTIAPDRNRSCVSHGSLFFAGYTVKKVGDKRWACSGLPTDCVSSGLLSDLLGCKIDMVIAGINFGPNLGSDIIFSGTCGAARQAVLYDVPGIAVSLDPIDWNEVQKIGWKFEPLADFVCNNVEKLMKLCVFGNDRSFVNINGGNFDKYKGVKHTGSICKRHYKDSVIFTPSEEDPELLVSKMKTEDWGTKCEPDGDYAAVHDGYISVSIVKVDPEVNQSVDDFNFSV